MGEGGELLATALLLLLASPLLGVGTLFAVRKAPLSSLRQLLLVNLGLTALTATAVWGFSATGESHDGEQAGKTVLRLVAATVPAVRPDAPPCWTITLSVGVDSLNRPALCWLAWGALATGLLTTGQAPESAGRYGLLLGLEAAWLWTYAAQDGVVFLGSLLIAGGLMAMLTAWWGHADRRTAAARLWQWWGIADGLLAVGIIGLAVAAVWAQQHITSTLPAVSFAWDTLARVLPRVAQHNQSAAQYWSASAGWWFWPLIVGIAIRSGVPPFHSAFVQWLGQVSAPVGVLTILGGLPLGTYLWERLVAPTFALELREQVAVIAGWGALATLGAGLYCLAQTEARKFAAWFTLAGSGLAWFLLSSDARAAADASATFAWGSAALLALIATRDEPRPLGQPSTFSGQWTIAPLWSAAVVVTFGSVVGFPAAARWQLDWQLAWSLAGARPGPFFVAMLGWLITGWAAVWTMQHWLWGDTEGASPSPTGRDLGRSEIAAVVILLLWLGLIASGWLSTLDQEPAAVTLHAVRGGIVG